MENCEQNEVSRALGEIWADYVEEHGAPEGLDTEDRRAVSENLRYIALQWQNEGNQLMAEGLKGLADRYA